MLSISTRGNSHGVVTISAVNSRRTHDMLVCAGAVVDVAAEKLGRRGPVVPHSRILTPDEAKYDARLRQEVEFKPQGMHFL